MNWFRLWKPVCTDGVIDLVPFRLAPPPAEMNFGRIYNFLIAPHGRKLEMGQIELRMGEGRCVYYFGHIGYHIDPPYQGNRYAMRACMLLRPLIQASNKAHIVITTDLDNGASRRTCELLGCEQERTVMVPEDVIARFDISSQKVRFIWNIQNHPSRKSDSIINGDT